MFLLACTDSKTSRFADEDTVVDTDEAAEETAAHTADSAQDTEHTAETDDTSPFVLDYPDRRVGMFYLTWHAFAADAMARTTPITVEDVIRASPALQFSDIVWDAGLYNEAAAFHYHQRPELGFYCLYRPRDGEAAPAEPNAVATCPDIPNVARTHADQLWGAGVDFVYVDLTNLPTWGDFADVLGLRPFEVLLEEWGALRAQRVATPQVAAWIPAVDYGDGSEPLIRRLLDVYDAAPDDLLLTHNGQAVVFIVSHGGLPPSDSLLAEVQARGYLPVKMWGNMSRDEHAAGTAAWMAPCTSGDSFTTLIEPGVACNQWYTTSSPLGTVVSASRSYQIGYASLPLQSSGRNGGLTFQRQLYTALAVQPDYLLLNAWNEHIAQPQPNPMDAGYGALRRSMGVVDTSSHDVSADWLWVDMYGAEFDRDFEPTVEDGGAGLALLESCLRVWRSGATTCSDGGEACCQEAEGMRLVRSFRAGGQFTDHAPTSDAAEIDWLRASGWTEVCNPHYGPPGLCGGGTTSDGPFFLYPSPGTDRAALIRCYSGADHFLSLDPACEGRTVEQTLGYLSTVRTSEAARALYRCNADTYVVHLHALDAHCPAGSVEEAVLGYVR